MSFCLFAGMMFAQPAFKVDENGRIGIGTANPTSNLEIKNLAGEVGAGLRFRSNNTTALFNYFDGGSDGLSSQWNMDAIPGKANGNVNLGFFRSTNTTGVVGFILFEAKNTANINTYLAASGNSYVGNVAGNLQVGTNTNVGANRLNVAGNAYKTSGGANWSIPSDRKLKSNVKSYAGGLNIISRMKPVEYDYNGKAGTVAGHHQIGVIAQELQKIAPFMVEEATVTESTMSEFAEITVTKEEKILTVNPSALKWMLVNAVNEQQTMIDELRKDNDELKSLLEEMRATIAIVQETKTATNLVGSTEIASLEQNTPNPFNGQTKVSYFVPANAQNALMTITNNAGQVIKTLPISHTGAGELELSTQDMPLGQYFYTLSIDGKLIDTKKMSLVR